MARAAIAGAAAIFVVSTAFVPAEAQDRGINDAQTRPEAADPNRVYPPPRHLRVFSDRTADRLEFERKLARRDGRTADAVELTWRLGARIAEVWGSHQTILWPLYMDVVDLWRGAGEHDKAHAALARMDTEFAGLAWFDDYERAALAFVAADLYARDAKTQLAERAFRRAFALAATADAGNALVAPCFHSRFADVLDRNGKADEAAQERALAGAISGPCNWVL